MAHLERGGEAERRSNDHTSTIQQVASMCACHLPCTKAVALASHGTAARSTWRASLLVRWPACAGADAGPLSTDSSTSACTGAPAGTGTGQRWSINPSRLLPPLPRLQAAQPRCARALTAARAAPPSAPAAAAAATVLPAYEEEALFYDSDFESEVFVPEVPSFTAKPRWSPLHRSFRLYEAEVKAREEAIHARLLLEAGLFAEPRGQPSQRGSS